MADRDFYQTLGVSRDSSAEEIKKVYRSLARELHPDRNPGDDAAEDRFKDVSHAYDVLSDPKKRGLYDRFGEAGLRDGFDPDAYAAHQAYGQGAGGFDFSDIFGGGGVGGQSGANFNFEDLFGRGAGGRGGARRKGQDHETSVHVEFDEAIRGCERELTLPGRGGERSRSVKVRIPAGVHEGGKVRLRGQGGEGAFGGPKGDLILKVKVGKHAHFWREREEENLHLRLPISPLEAYRGAKITVPTPAGDVQLRIPAGAQGGQKLRLKGKGVERRKGGRGDLIAHLMIRIPPRSEEGDPEMEAALSRVEEGFETPLRDELRL